VFDLVEPITYRTPWRVMFSLFLKVKDGEKNAKNEKEEMFSSISM
jgi:hypothetical protein